MVDDGERFDHLLRDVNKKQLSCSLELATSKERYRRKYISKINIKLCTNKHKQPRLLWSVYGGICIDTFNEYF